MSTIPHYSQSDSILKGKVYLNPKNSVAELKAMDIDRRWNEDNRIATWNFGMQNFGFDENHRYIETIINDTDDFVLNILDENEITGTRQIKYNGRWMIPNI